jgi:imidazolonepropionase-like amidohydrolase
MQRFSGHYVFPVAAPAVYHGIVVTDGQGKVLEVADPAGEARELAGTIFYNGVLVPGFILHITVAGSYHEEVWKRIDGMLAGRGCRFAIVMFRNRAFRADLLYGKHEEMTMKAAGALRESLVAIRIVPGEEVTAEDLFPAGGRKAFEERLYALTLAGAEATGLKDTGRLERGFTPGVVLLEMDFERWKARRSLKVEG